MGLRAVMNRTRGRLPGAAPGRDPCASALLFAVLALLLSASSAAAQRAVAARAVVHVPTVSQLDVEPVATPRPSTTGASTTGASATGASATGASATGALAGVLRLHVRANHRWELMLTVPTGVGAVRVRRTGATEFERLEPGATMVVARGARGSETVALEYRCEGAASVQQGLPVRPTLAAAER